MLTLIIFILFLTAIEIYSYFGLRVSLFSDRTTLFTIIYLATTLFTVVGIFIMFKSFANPANNQTLMLNIATGLFFSLIVAKLNFTSLFIIEDLLRSFLWLFQSVFNFRSAEFISRSYIWGLFSFSTGVLTLLFLNYGVWFGKYHFKVHHKILTFENLPDEFDGFKIAQLSDLHLGTFDSKKRVQKGFDLLQEQNPDVIVFTGDIINNRAEETLLYIDAIKNLHAPFGKYIIWGNHDYGDYMRWENKAEKVDNQEKLEGFGRQMGFQWLNNKHVALTKGDDTIYLAGVENWGLPPFPQHGKLNEAIEGLSLNDFVVLLSHDPTHWREVVLKTAKNIGLTLSGHTHGMQFGVEIGKFRWSPVKYKYSDWADLYESSNQYLYVNRGFGNIGYPGRVGIRPEVTIIELRLKGN